MDVRPRPNLPAAVPRFVALVAFLLALAVAVALGWPGSVPAAPDLQQERLNFVPPAPAGSQTLQQTFTPGHDGLASLEILLARRTAAGTAEQEALILTLADGGGRIVAQQSWDTGRLRHNQPLQLRFAPESASAGATYTLTLSGSAANSVSAWAYSLDVLDEGFLSGAAEGDLRLVTEYVLTWRAALARVAAQLQEAAGIFGAALLLLPLPGVLFLQRWRRAATWDPAAWWGTALALGVATWPLLWLWLTLPGLRLTRGLLWLLLLGGWTVAAWQWRHRRRPRWRYRWQLSHGLLAALLLVGLFLRLVAVGDQAFPAWVDASRHGLITALLVETGRFPSGYAPLLAVDGAPYHYGFHTLAAGVALLSQAPLPALLLYFGQLLNALVPLTVYSGAWLLTRRRPPALAAAFLVALPFYFPAYYATWGRFTQLTGMLLLPVLLGLTWLLLRGAHVRRRGSAGDWLAVALGAAGLFLIHARVFLFFLPFAPLLWLAGRGRAGRRLLAAAAAGGLLILPRIVALLAERGNLALSASGETYNAFPTGYVTVGWERYYWLAAGIVLLAALSAAARRRRWSTAPLLIAAWAALLALLLSGRRVGLPELWVINLGSLYIALFVPQAWLLGMGIDRLLRPAARVHWLLRLGGAALLGSVGALLLLYGGRQQAAILNQATLLARPADRAGLDFVATALPEDALVASHGWLWLGAAWAGSDGGAWLLPVTGRSTTMPPVDYTYDADLLARINGFQAAAAAVDDWSTPEAAAWLHGQGVTHIFVGARGGYFDPAALARNEALILRYTGGGAFVFELRPP